MEFEEQTVATWSSCEIKYWHFQIVVVKPFGFGRYKQNLTLLHYVLWLFVAIIKMPSNYQKILFSMNEANISKRIGTLLVKWLK
jgi:hypothetical protein